jgi:hypothetical protein
MFAAFWKQVYEELMTNRNLIRHFDLYTDGSVRSQRQGKFRLGVGWVIKENSGTYAQTSMSVPRAKSGSCIVAEFMAAALAIKTIPTGSHVTLHTDSKSLREFLIEGVLPKGGPGSMRRDQYLLEAAQLLLKNAFRHVVVPVTAHDRSSPDLKRAHTLAREATASLPRNDA